MSWRVVRCVQRHAERRRYSGSGRGPQGLQRLQPIVFCPRETQQPHQSFAVEKMCATQSTKTSYSRRELAALGVERYEWSRRRTIGREDLDERAFREVALEAVARRLDKAEACTREVGGGVSAVHRHPARHRDLARLAVDGQLERHDVVRATRGRKPIET